MQKIRNVIGVFVFISAVIPTLLWADPPPVELSGSTLTVESAANTLNSQASLALPEIVVTANRLDTPASQVTSSLTVITAKEMEQKQSTTLLDALKTVPGLDIVRTGGPGETSSIYTRGSNDAHTLVMMDGIPLNDPLSAARSYDYLDQLSVDDVKQIEVVRGPQSTLYGSNAMTGVVNIITQYGQGPFGGSLLFEGGAYGTFLERILAGGGDNGGNYSLALSRFDTAGFPSADKAMGNTLNNLDQNTTASLKLGASLTSNFQENFILRYNQSHTSLDDGSGPGMDDPNNFADQKQFLVGSQSKLKLLDGDWEQVLGISFADNNRLYTDDPSATALNAFYYRGNFDGQTGQLSWQNNLRLAKEETVIVGLQGYGEWGVSSNSFDPTILATPTSANAAMGSLYAESQTGLGERFFINEGGRLDVHSQFGSHTTYQGGLAYFIPGLETKLKANYGTGFLAPTLFQLDDPTYGNKGLQPENSTGLDVGFEQPLGGNFLKVGATYFHEDFNNLIQFQSTGLFTGNYANIGQAQSDGVETFADFRGIHNLEVRADYTYTNARDTRTGLPLIQRPQHKGSLDVFYQWDVMELGTTVAYVGPKPDMNFSAFPATPVTLDSYFLVNLRASYRLNDRVKIFARVDNLFNQYYEEIWGYGTPGLSAYGGIKVSY